MKFHNYLQHMLENHSIKQTTLVVELQLFHATFKSLDTITLSRWLNHKTKPNLEKQLLVAFYFEKDLSNFIKKIKVANPPISFVKTFSSLFDQIETSYTRIKYNPPSESNSELSLLNLDKNTHRHLFGGFYKQMSTYSRIFDHIDDNNNDVQTTVFVIKQGSTIISHLSLNKDITQIAPHFRRPLPGASTTKSVLINVGYYSCRQHWGILVGHLLNYLIEHLKDIDVCYVTTRGRGFLELLQMIGGTMIMSSQELPAIGNIYLIKFNVTQLLAHPFLFQQIQIHHLSYIELSQNSTINLQKQ